MLESMLMFLTCLFSYVLWKLTAREQNKIKYYVKFLFYYFYVLFIALFMLPVLSLTPGSDRHRILGSTNSWFAGLITYLYDLDYDLRNREILSEERGAVIVANHQSSFDFVFMCKIWKIAYKMTAVAKKELYYFWPFGLASKLAGVIFIDRSQPKAAYESMKATMHVMQENKTKVWVFPEGTRNKNPTEFLPFKKGAFAMAVAAQVPILPIVFSPYYFINKNKHIFTRGQIIIQCLEPVPTKGLTEEDIPALIENVREKMFTTYKELRKELLNNLPSDYPYPIEC